MNLLETAGRWFSDVPGLGTFASVLAIALVGWVVALIASSLVNKLVSKVDSDNRASDLLFEQSFYGKNRLAKFGGRVTFWGVLAFAALSIFNKLGLTAVSNPFETALSGLAFGVPSIIKAVVILVVGLVIAKVVKSIVSSGWIKLRLDQRIDSLLHSDRQAQAVPAARAHLAGTVGFFAVLFLVIPAALNALGIEVLGNAIGGIWADVFGFLPRVLSAAIIFGVGYVIATLVRGAVTKLIASTSADHRGARWFQATTVSKLVGTLLFFAIMFPVTIAGVDALGISAISQPLNAMVSQIVAFAPKLIVAGLIVAVFAFVAKFARSWAQSFLAGVGADAWPTKLGLNASEDNKWAMSNVAASVLGVVILWFGVSQALMTLELGALQQAASAGLAFLPKLIVGGAILVAGVYFGEVARKMVAGRKENHLAMLAKITIIAFAGVAAADQVGIAERFALIGFTVIMASVGLGAALAFGLGSRDVANAYVRKNFDMTKMSPVFEEDTLVPEGEFVAQGTEAKSTHRPVT